MPRRARRAAPLALLLAVLAAGCGAGGDTGDPGAALYRAQNCANCHGEEAVGGPLAPPLRGLAAHWTRDDLARYLRDPRGFAGKSARTRELEDEYTRIMPPYSNLTGEERGALAGWLLGLD